MLLFFPLGWTSSINGGTKNLWESHDDQRGGAAPTGLANERPGKQGWFSGTSTSAPQLCRRFGAVALQLTSLFVTMGSFRRFSSV